MIVIGNDLIDLSYTENLRTFSRKGIEKFFSVNENRFVEKLNKKYSYAFMWAIKESIFKCMIKLGSKKAMGQVKIINEIKILNNLWYGSTIVEENIYFYSCCLDKNYIKCVASNSIEAIEGIQSFVLTKNSVSVYDEIVEFIKRDFSVEELIKTTNNIPVLISKDKEKYLDISLSNEGNDYFVSYYPKLTDIEDCIYLEVCH